MVKGTNMKKLTPKELSTKEVASETVTTRYDWIEQKSVYTGYKFGTVYTTATGPSYMPDTRSTSD